MIPKNTSLIIARIPLAQQFKKSWAPPEPQVNHQPTPDSDSVNLDLSRMNGSEEDKIAAMMMQSTQEYDPTK